MSIKITGYRIYKSSGGNVCVQCKTRMRKGLPYIAPIAGKKITRELTGKSICVSCTRELISNVESKIAECGIKELERYDQRRFMEHLG